MKEKIVIGCLLGLVIGLLLIPNPLEKRVTALERRLSLFEEQADRIEREQAIQRRWNTNSD